MKLKYEGTRFVIEPQTAADHEVLMLLADQAGQVGDAGEGALLDAPSCALPWECAVADALGAQLEGMSCESVNRVLGELRRMNAASTGTFDTPVRAVPSLPVQEG